MTEAPLVLDRPAAAGAVADVLDHPFVRAVRDASQPMTLADPTRPDCPLVFVNQAFLDMTGYGEGEVLGRNCRFLQGPLTDRDTVARIRAAVTAHEPLCVDVLNYRKDGTAFWNQLVLSPLFGPDGRLLYYFGSQLDVSDRHRTQDALAQALEMQRALVRDMNHRIANSFTLVLAMMRLQRSAMDDADGRALLDTLENRIRATAEVHHALHRGHGDRVTIAADVFLHRLVDGVRDSMIATADGALLTFDLALAPVRLPADQAIPLGIVVTELVTNAAKHAMRGGRPPHLALTLLPARDGGRLCLRVSDDGPGPAAPLSAGTERGSGLDIVAAMTRQLNAAVLTGFTAAGSWTEITFPLQEAASLAAS